MQSTFCFHSRSGSSIVESDFKIPNSYINLYNSIHFFKIGFPYGEKVPRSQIASCVSESIKISIDGIIIRKRDLVKIMKLIKLTNIELLNYVLVIIDYYELANKYYFKTRKSNLYSNLNDGKLNRISIGNFNKILNNVNLALENFDDIEKEMKEKKNLYENNINKDEENSVITSHLRSRPNISINIEVETNSKNLSPQIKKDKEKDLSFSEISTSIEKEKNSPISKLKTTPKEKEKLFYNSFNDKNKHSNTKNNISLPTMILVNTPDKQLQLIPESIIYEILDDNHHRRISSLEYYDPIKKGKFTLKEDNEIFYPSYNKNNELNKVIILNNIKGDKIAIKNVFLKSFIYKALHKQNLPDNIKLFDIYNKEQMISKNELKKLVSQSRLAECLNNEDEILTLYDLEGNCYKIIKKSLQEIYDKFINDENFKLTNQMKVLDENGDSVLINPFNLRNYNILDEIKKNKYIHPYITVDENNSFFEITNIKENKKCIYSRKKIISMINSKNLTLFDINEIKLVLHPNNSYNELFKIKLPNDKNMHFIKKSYFENVIYNLINNLKIYENILIEKNNNLKVIDYKGEEIILNIKNILLNNYTINSSPYIKNDILNIDNITYYHNDDNQILHKTEINEINFPEINLPGIELIELINVIDLEGKNCFIRKPFLRNILYNNPNILYSDIDVIDPVNDIKHKINLNSIISKFDIDESNLDNIVIPKYKIFLFIKDRKGKEHIINKEMIYDVNKMIKKNIEEKKDIDYIFVDDNDIIFKPIIEENKIKVNSNREWVKIKDINNKEVFIYIKIIKHILNGDYDNKLKENILNVIDSYGQKQNININIVKKELKEENINKGKILIIPEKIFSPITEK